MTPKSNIDQQGRIERRNREYEDWVRKNPGKKFSDFYVEKVSAQLDRGQPHATIGGRLKGDLDFHESGKPVLEHLIARGLKPEHTCVDYGCGSLRVGQHIMQYLDPGNFWGVDITDRFYNEGLRLLDDGIIDRCKPNLRIIDKNTVQEVAAAEPDFLFAMAVLIHVPPAEVDEFWDRIMTCITGKTQTMIKIKCSDEPIQYSGRSWSYPESMIEDAVASRGGRCHFDAVREEFNDELDYQIRHFNLDIKRI